MKRICVILLNMGGPSRGEEVQPFLEAMFRDPDLIQFPFKNILAPFIIRRRTPVARARYAQIPGGSPLLKMTMAQAEALEKNLNKNRQATFRVIPGMRYTQPTISDAVETAVEWECDELVGLSMYPQYCAATIGSSILELKRVAAVHRVQSRLTIIDRYSEHPLYIQAVQAVFEQTVRGFNATPFVLFSAHGVPLRMVRRGDPYVSETEATVKAVTQSLGLGEGQYRLAYQSRMGPVRWVGPSTDQVINELGDRGIKNLVFVPISFTVDNLETLYDIEIIFKKQAHDAKIEHVLRTPALNVIPEFISALESLVKQAIELPLSVQ